MEIYLSHIIYTRTCPANDAEELFCTTSLAVLNLMYYLINLGIFLINFYRHQEINSWKNVFG